MDILLYFTTSTLTLILGYYLGSRTSVEVNSDVQKVVSKIAPAKYISEVGGVKKITQEEARYKRSPEREEDDAMTATLDRLFIDD